MISEGHAIHRVQQLIERCLLFWMDREECADCLQQTANLQPAVTRIVWDELEKSNVEFFTVYSSRRLELLHAHQQYVRPPPPQQPQQQREQQHEPHEQQHPCSWRVAASQKENRPTTLTAIVGSCHPQTLESACNSNINSHDQWAKALAQQRP